MHETNPRDAFEQFAEQSKQQLAQAKEEMERYMQTSRREMRRVADIFRQSPNKNQK